MISCNESGAPHLQTDIVETIIGVVTPCLGMPLTNAGLRTLKETLLLTLIERFGHVLPEKKLRQIAFNYVKILW